METIQHHDQYADRSPAKLSQVTLLDVRRVADLLGIHQRTVWRLVSTNELPKPVKLGAKTVRWRLSDLERYVQGL